MRRTSLPCLAVALLTLSLTACSAGGASSESAAAQLAFGVQMAQQGLWSEALFRFHQAERMQPQNPHVHNNIAVAYEANGDFDKALEYYQRALQLAPESREARGNYARFVEFYQSYKPKDAKAAPTAAGSPGSSDSAPPPPGEEPGEEAAPRTPPVLSPDPGEVPDNLPPLPGRTPEDQPGQTPPVPPPGANGQESR